MVKTIDDVLTELLGEMNTQIIYGYLRKKSCPTSEICQKLEVFSMELRMLLGSGRGQILGSAAILEKTVLNVLCLRIGIKYNPERMDFPDYVKELKKVYQLRKQAPQFKIEMEVNNP